MQAHPMLQPRSALSCFPLIHRVDLEGQERVDFGRSPSRRPTTGICAHRTAGDRAFFWTTIGSHNLQERWFNFCAGV